MFMRTLFASLCFLAAGWPALAETPAQARWQPKSGDEIRFNVTREGKPFGSHVVTFETAPDGTLKATTEVSLKAGLGPVTLFRYNLAATETWMGGKLVALTGKVNDDGKKRSVTARRESGALKVAGSDFTGTAPAGIVPASHWNVAEASARQLLSTEDGEIIDVKVTEIGPDRVNVGSALIDATHFRLDSAIDVDLWYDAQGRWVKLAFVARGQQI